MNSKLRKIIYHISQHPLDDEDHEFDEDFEAAEKAIRQAVGEEMLELIGEDEMPGVGRMIGVPQVQRDNFRAELRQKIKEWSKETTL